MKNVDSTLLYQLPPPPPYYLTLDFTENKKHKPWELKADKHCFKCISELARKVSLCLQEIDPVQDGSFIFFGQVCNQYIGKDSAYHSPSGLQCGMVVSGGSPE